MDDKLTTSPIYIFFRSIVIYRTGGLLLAWKGIVTNGLGADKSLPHWLSWDDRIFKRSGEVLGSAGISDPWAEMSGQGTALQTGGTATGWVLCLFVCFFFFSKLVFVSS